MERKLREIAFSSGINPPNKGLSILVSELEKHHLLNTSEVRVLQDLIPILNRAAHGEQINTIASAWVKSIARSVLDKLDLKLTQP